MKGKLIAQNKQAYFNYFIEDSVEAGLVLLGSEVKSIRLGKVNITDAHAAEKDGCLYLLNTHVAEYPGSNRFNHEPTRPKKILLHKRQENKFLGAIKKKGITLVPLKLYFSPKGLIKLELGMAKGKKMHDKRAAEKEKSWNKEKQTLLKKNAQSF